MQQQRNGRSRRLTGVGLLLAGMGTLAGLACPAHADNWAVTYEVNGLDTWDHFTDMYYWTNDTPDQWVDHFSSAPPENSRVVVTAKLTWTGAPSPAPDIVRVRETAIAYGEAQFDSSSDSTVTPSADDGLGHEATGEPSAVPGYYPWMDYYKTSSGAIVKTYSVNQTTGEVILPTRTLTAAIHMHDGTNGLIDIPSTYLYYKVQEDPRAVEIDCPQIETSYQKVTGSIATLPEGWDLRSGSPVPPSAGPYSLAHTPNYDRSKITDSAVDWSGTFNSWITDKSFIADKTGVFQSPTYDWKLTGANTPRSGAPNTNGHDTFTVGLNFGNDADSFPKATTVTLKVKDNVDLTEAQNTFAVNWHLPYEKDTLVSSVPMKSKVRKLAGPIDPGDSENKVGNPAEDFDIWGAIDNVGVLAGALGHEEIPGGIEIIKAAADLGSLVFEYEGDPNPDGSSSNEWTNDDGKWVPATQIPSWAQNIEGAAEHPAWLLDEHGYLHYNMEIHEVKHFHRKTWLADKYDYHGYVDSGHILTADPIDGIDQEPYYILRPEFPPGE